MSKTEPHLKFALQLLLTGKGGLKGHISSISKSQSCMTLNGSDSGIGRRSRSDSVSSLRSLRSLSNPFEVLSTDDMTLDDDDSDSERSSMLSQDVFDESNQDLTSSMSSLHFEMDTSLLDKIATAKPIEPSGQNDDGLMQVVTARNYRSISSNKELKRENGGLLNLN